MSQPKQTFKEWIRAEMPHITRADFQLTGVIIRREVRDSFRDWRIIGPIIMLTLFFPFLMNFTADRLLELVGRFGDDLVADRLIPFLLLIVGFFPMSFSLVIALETFVGEKERKSLEPLLATPLTNSQLYVGKIVAAIIPPLLAAYLGIGVYLISLAFTVQWVPPLELLVQALFLTTIQGVVMVSAAVVISSRTTTIRASNLLASLIIVPMAILIQSEAAVLFFANYKGLWWIILGMAVIAIILIRMGVHNFNREELLGSTIDKVQFIPLFKLFFGRLTGRNKQGRFPNPLLWYRQTFSLLPRLQGAMAAMMVMVLLAVFVGVALAQQYAFPTSIQGQLQREVLSSNVGGTSMFSAGLPIPIFLQNAWIVFLQVLTGSFSLGVLGVIVFMLPWSFLSFMAAQIALAGEDPWLFLSAAVLPHAVFELPALLLIAAAAFRWHIVFIAPPPNHTVGEGWMIAGAEFMRILLGIAVPILFVASYVEAFITPQILQWVYGVS